MARYRQDPYAALATSITPQAGGVSAFAQTYYAGQKGAAEAKAQGLREAQFQQTKRAQDQAMMINQEKFDQQQRIIQGDNVLSEMQMDEFSTLGNLPSGTEGNVFDENAFMTQHYGPLGDKKAFINKYLSAVERKGAEKGLTITPNIQKAEQMYRQFSAREAEQKLNSLLQNKQFSGQTAKEFNLYLRGAGNTHTGSNAVNYYLQQVEAANPGYADAWGKQTGYVHGYETGWESVNPFVNPGGEVSGGLPKSTTGESAKGLALAGAGVGLGLEGVGYARQQHILSKAKTSVDDLLKNKNLYGKDGKLKGGKNSWKTFLTDDQKKLLGDKLDDIKGKKGLDEWAKSQKSKLNAWRPSQFGKKMVPKIGVKGVIGGAAPFALPSAGQLVAGDEGQLAGRLGASAVFASQSFKNFTGRPLGFFKFAKKVMGPRLAKFGAKAAARQATAAAAGAVGGAGVGAIPTSIGMGLLNAGLSVWEVKKLFDDYKEYQKTGKISP